MCSYSKMVYFVGRLQKSKRSSMGSNQSDLWWRDAANRLPCSTRSSQTNLWSTHGKGRKNRASSVRCHQQRSQGKYNIHQWWKRMYLLALGFWLSAEMNHCNTELCVVAVIVYGLLSCGVSSSTGISSRKFLDFTIKSVNFKRKLCIMSLVKLLVKQFSKLRHCVIELLMAVMHSCSNILRDNRQ